MTASYAEFLASKRLVAQHAGIDVAPGDIHPALFGFQRDLVRWALRKGRAALFASTGLGKTLMQLEWARLTGERTLILAPLAVAQQTVREATKIGLDVVYARDQGEAAGQIVVTNYERLHKFDPSAFGAVVLDESSILKAFSGTTKKALVAAFRDTPFRLACTATPAPNDLEELCNHADFLGVMSPAEMRSTFFIADSRGQFMRYRLKRHAHTPFYRWLASWAMAVNRPSDLGHPDDGFDLPELHILPVTVPTDWAPDGQLFADALKGVTQRAEVRKATLEARVNAAVRLIEAAPSDRWLVWCGLNDEARKVAAAIPNAVNVEGPDAPEAKEQALLGFAEGRTRVLVTKPTIAGFGMNFQSCARMVFVGLGDSWEQYYQAIRRCWRFGQTREVRAYIVISEIERAIYDNVLRKEEQAEDLARQLIVNVAEYERAELLAGTTAADTYEPVAPVAVPDWLVGAS